MIPIYHKPCGAIIGHDLRENTDDKRMMSQHFRRIDGTRPQYRERFNETCPNCKARIMSGAELRMGTTSNRSGGTSNDMPDMPEAC